MNWQDWAALATIVQSVVVVISLVLVVLQLRQQTQLAKAANGHRLVELTTPFNLQFMVDDKLTNLMVNGWREHSASRDEVETYQYVSLLVWWLMLHEDIFFQKRQGLLDDRLYDSWDRSLRDFVDRQHLEVSWDAIQDIFRSDFGAYVSQLVDQVSVRRVAK